MALLNVDMNTTRPCSVPCLYGFIDLEQECEKSDLKLSQETKKVLMYELMRKLGHSQSQKLISKCFGKEAQEWKSDYEVESILDHCRDEQDGQMYYLIKWVDWGHQFNSWEPEQNLYCQQLLREYNQGKRRWSRKKRMLKQEDQRGVKKRKLDELFQIFKESTIFDKLSPLNILKSYNSDSTNPRMNEFLTQLQPKQLRKKKIHHKLLHQEAIAALQVWQDDLNGIIKGHDPAPIIVENNVDLEGPPDDFIYINERKEGPGVVIPKDPLIGCDCHDCYQDRKSCCAVASGSVLAYKSNGRLRVPRGVPIYECNIRCKCGPKCLNRVIQKGRKFKICIFRTNGRGWGVKAMQKIKKGSFVMEYVGEVITNEEAERRGKDYDAAGRTYLFDLDFHDDDAPFSVDAGTYGNAAHFINHSCNPNLEVYVVWINTLDPHLPHICLFAKRDIERDEELTFDYMSGNLPHEEDLSVDDVHNTIAPKQTGAISSDKTLDIHHFMPLVPNDLEFTAVRQPGIPLGAVECTDRSETQSSWDTCDKKSCLSVTSSSVIHTMNDLPTPGAEAESEAARDPEDASSVREESKFSMACLCGASNCRKFLFF